MNLFPKELSWYKLIIDLLLPAVLLVIGYILGSRGRRIADISTWKTRRDEILAHAESVIKTISDLEGLCEEDPKRFEDFWHKRSSLLCQLSCLRDYGRFIMPNIFSHSYGKSKPSAYQGFRSNATECITAAFHIAAAINYNLKENNKEPTSLPAENSKSQAGKIRKGLTTLPREVDLTGPTIEGKKQNGWSCKSALIAAKRQYVSEIYDLLHTRLWVKILAEFSPKAQDAKLNKLQESVTAHNERGDAW